MNKILEQYDYAINLNHNLIKVLKDDKYGCIDNNGTVVLPTIYDEILDFNEDNLAVIKIADKLGYMNWIGEIIIPVEYNHFDDIYVSEAGIYYYYDDAPFDDLDGEKLIRADKNGKIYFFNLQGELIDWGLDINLIANAESKGEAYAYFPSKFELEKCVSVIAENILKNKDSFEGILFSNLAHYCQNPNNENIKFTNVRLELDGEEKSGKNLNLDKIKIIRNKPQYEHFNSFILGGAIYFSYQVQREFQGKVNYPYKSLTTIDNKFIIEYNDRYNSVGDTIFPKYINLFAEIKEEDWEDYYDPNQVYNNFCHFNFWEQQSKTLKIALKFEIFYQGYLIFYGLDEEQFLEFAKQEFGITKESLLAELEATLEKGDEDED